MRPGGKEGVQVLRKRVELRQGHPVEAHECVVAQHRRNRDRKPQRGHDQRFAVRPGDLVERALPAHADRGERVVHAPDGAEQSDERRGAADRGEHGQAGLDPRGFLVDHAAYGAGQELRAAARQIELVGAVELVIARRDDAVIGEMRKRLVRMILFQLRRDCTERSRIPA